MNPVQLPKTINSDISDLLALLSENDFAIEDETLARILQAGDEIVHELAEIVEQTIEKSRHVNLSVPH